jgi:glutamate formiminotransferase/formiminotetrahydrofolate cyclodeaminase
MSECIDLARTLGKRVGEELSIPVYLYEEAASRPDRQNLEAIRKGQYEGLKEEIHSNPDRIPDFGPSMLGSAGATVIGARAPLIAFNIYLNTTDLAIAQKVAKAVRNSSGGLRFVKAMGVLVDGLAQVSMNLTNFRQTPIPRVFEMVRREAARFGAGIHHSELVGLIPQAALVDTAVWYTQLDQFDPNQILESRLYGNRESTAAEGSFLEDLASEQPTPGGGSAAAYTAAEAAALVAMVGRVTIGKKKYIEVEDLMKQVVEEVDRLRAQLTMCVKEDAEAFNGFLEAVRLPKDTDKEKADRIAAMESATINAARVPLRVAALANRVLEISLQAAENGNVNAISDAASAANLAIAAIRSAALNVKINLKSLVDSEVKDGMAGEIKALLDQISSNETTLAQILAKRAEL